MTRIIIVGGSDAGISAALRAKEIAPTAEVTVVVADSFPNYSVCGLPYYLSGEVANWHSLAHRTEAEIERHGIRLLLNHAVQRINLEQKQILAATEGQLTPALAYDKLIIATGAVPTMPRIAGADLPGVYLLRSMTDSFLIQDHLTMRSPRSAVVIGGGYIGLEMAESLTRRGLHVTVVEHNPTVMKTMDAALGNVVQSELERHGVEVVTGIGIENIEQVEARLLVKAADFRRTADLVIMSVGVTPATDLARGAGVEVGHRGAIQVNQRMETSIEDIYAAGDCAETWHHLLNEAVYLPLGSTAHKQGRVAGENAAGGRSDFAGTLGTQVVKVFDLAAARTGLNDPEAREAGFDPLAAEIVAWDHKAYYPGAHELRIQVTGDRVSGRLLGAQMIGHKDAEVAKRIDIFATALFHGMSVDALNDLDLSYTPPFSSPWDPVQMSAQAWSKIN